jgi:hypothetical protein
MITLNGGGVLRHHSDRLGTALGIPLSAMVRSSTEGFCCLHAILRRHRGGGVGQTELNGSLGVSYHFLFPLICEHMLYVCQRGAYSLKYVLIIGRSAENTLAVGSPND